MFPISIFTNQNYINNTNISASPESLGWQEVDLALKSRGLEISFDKKKSTPMTAAIELNDVELCKKVLACGLDINAACKAIVPGNPEEILISPILFAILGNYFKAASFLLEKGALFDFHAANGNVNDPLSIALLTAIDNGSKDTIHFLISRGVTLNFLIDGLSLFQFFIDKPSKIHFLIECGANPNQKNEEGSTPLFIAASRGLEESCRMLLDHGGEINALNENNQNPLYAAIYSQNEKLVRYLLQQKGNPNQVGKNGETNLFWAAYLGSQGICQALIENGGDPNAISDDLNTPLHSAAQSKNEKLISYLLTQGANARVLNKYGDTPLAVLRKDLATFPKDHYLDLKEKDKGLTDLMFSLNLLGHRFSLEGPFFEGSTIINTYHEMADSLTSYIETRQITDPFLLELPLIFNQSIENKENIDYFMKSIDEGKLTILPVGWLGHQTSLVIWGNLLCKVNRGGASGDNPGFKIYEIQKPSNCRSALKSLLRSNHILQADLDNFQGEPREILTLTDTIMKDKIRFFNEDIDNLLELKQLHYLHSNYQKTGNCTWIAAKMSFKAALLLFHLQKNPKMEMDTFPKQVKTLYSDWLNFDYVRGLSVLPRARDEPLVNSKINIDAIYNRLLGTHFKSKRAALLEVFFQQCPEL